MIDLPDLFPNFDFEAFFYTLNYTFAIIYSVIKYVLIALLITIGVLTMKKYRGFYNQERMREHASGEDKFNKDDMKEPHIILGVFYVCLAMGFLIGWIPRLMALVFPDGFLFAIVGSLIEIETILEPYRSTIYLCIGYASLWGFLSIILGFRFMALYSNKSHVTAIKLLFTGIVNCVFTGFATFVPFFL